MAGYVIHLAVGEEHLRNFPDEIKNHEEFIEGIIFPDSVTDKSLTHYGPKSSKVNLRAFFEEKDIDTDFNKGYFVHILTDYIFYNHFLEKFSPKYIYRDYDILNGELEKEFNVKMPEKLEKNVPHMEGETVILKLEEVKDFIRKVGKYNLEEIKKEVLNRKSKLANN